MTSPSRRRRLLLGAALFVLLSCVPEAHASTLFGFNDNAALYGQVSPSTDATAAANAGANSTRITVDWRAVEPQQGVRNFARYDPLYNAAVAKNQKPLFVILFAPAWARSPGVCPDGGDCTYPPDPSHAADFGAFAAAVAKRYPKAAGIEVWNEPNLKIFWGGQPVDPAAYTELLKASYTAVKAVAPTMPVITGGLTPYGGEDGTNPGMGVRQFLDGMYDAGAKGSYDGIGLHAYTSWQLWYGYRAITLVKESMANHRDSAPMWWTELNVSTTGPDGVGATDQGRYIQRFIPRFRARTDVNGVWVHTLYDPTWVEPTSTDAGYGMLTSTGKNKPAYCVLAALYARKTCATPTADATQSARWDAEERLQSAAEAAIRYRAANGSYTGITASSMGGTALPGDAMPGSAADPSRLAVFPGSDAGRSLLVCNASKADRTYCIWTTGDGSWLYGSGTGSIYGTAGALTTGAVWWW